MDEILKAIKVMILAQNWRGYLHFRRQLFLTSEGGSTMFDIYRELHDNHPEAMQNYVNYFGIEGLPTRVKKHYSSKLKSG